MYSLSSPQHKKYLHWAIYPVKYNHIYNIHKSSKDEKSLQVGTNIWGKIIKKTYAGGFNLGTLSLEYNLYISCMGTL